MKEYANGMKASTVTRKQVGVLYGMAKRGEIKVEKFVMKDFYDTAEYYGYDWGKGVEFDERLIKVMINLAFEKKIDELQAAIDRYTESLFSRLSKKKQQAADRELVA